MPRTLTEIDGAQHVKLSRHPSPRPRVFFALLRFPCLWGAGGTNLLSSLVT